MTSSYRILSFLPMFLSGFAMAAVLCIVWIGWLRTRKVAYLILAVWALTVLAGLAISYLPTWWVFVLRRTQPKLTNEFMIWTSLLRTVVSSTLLIWALSLLVFRGPRGTSDRST